MDLGILGQSELYSETFSQNTKISKKKKNVSEGKPPLLL